jgi:hypothetical protein
MRVAYFKEVIMPLHGCNWLLPFYLGAVIETLLVPYHAKRASATLSVEPYELGWSPTVPISAFVKGVGKRRKYGSTRSPDLAILPTCHRLLERLLPAAQESYCARAGRQLEHLDHRCSSMVKGDATQAERAPEALAFAGAIEDRKVLCYRGRVRRQCCREDVDNVVNTPVGRCVWPKKQATVDHLDDLAKCLSGEQYVPAIPKNVRLAARRK